MLVKNSIQLYHTIVMFNRDKFNFQNLIKANYYRFILLSPIFMGMGVLVGLASYPIYGAYLLTLLAMIIFQVNRHWLSLVAKLSAGACLWVAIGWISGFVKVEYFSAVPIIRSQAPKIITAKVLNSEHTQYGFRLTLQDTVSKDTVRLTYRRKKPVKVNVGDLIKAKVKLMPHKREIYPGGFNFRQKNAFEGIIATGALLSDPKIIQARSTEGRVNWIRQKLNNKIDSLLSSQTAMIAKALMTGEKTGLSQKTRDVYIKAGVAHVLAISGLHLTLIAGLVFFIIRRFLCLIPGFIHRYDSKKIAAVFSTLALFGYVLISGASVPTVRAFIMFCVLMLGILVDRQALSIRMIMVAAIGVLIIKPESIIMPGFHLSFAAVLALIAFYESNRQFLSRWLDDGGILKKVILYGAGVLMTSFIASFATLPFSIYHFHQFSVTGIFANLFIIPLMSFWIMPCILIYLLTGLDFGIQLAGQGIKVMTFIAEYFAALPGSEIFVPQLPVISLALMAAGIIWICLWHGWVRWIGLLFYVGSFLPLFWIQQPVVLVSEDAKLVGINDGNHLSVSSPRAKSFVTQIWAGSLGYNPAMNTSWRKDKKAVCDDQKNCLYQSTGMTVAYLKTLDNLQDYCRKSDILISQQPVRKGRSKCLGPKIIIDRFDVWRNGSYIIFKQGNKFIPKT